MPVLHCAGSVWASHVCKAHNSAEARETVGPGAHSEVPQAVVGQVQHPEGGYLACARRSRVEDTVKHGGWNGKAPFAAAAAAPTTHPPGRGLCG